MRYFILALSVAGSCKAYAAGLPLSIILGTWAAVVAVLADAASRE